MNNLNNPQPVQPQPDPNQSDTPNQNPHYKQTPLSSIPPNIFLKKQPSLNKPPLAAHQLHQQRRPQAHLRSAQAQIPHRHHPNHLNHQAQLQQPPQAKPKNKTKTIRYATKRSQFVSYVLLTISMVCIVSLAIIAWIVYFYARSI